MADQRIEQPGLRLRLSAQSRRISLQHRQLDAIYQAVVEALARGGEQEGREALGRFRDAWDAHTSLEDGFYFPALRGLRPELAARVEALSAEHATLRESLGRVEAAFGDAAAREEALERFVGAVADHERREEELLDEIAEPGGRGSG